MSEELIKSLRKALEDCTYSFDGREKMRTAMADFEVSISREAEQPVDDIMVKMSELMRGLEIPPQAIGNPPYFFYLVGKAVADQAKQAPNAQTITQSNNATREDL